MSIEEVFFFCLHKQHDILKYNTVAMLLIKLILSLKDSGIVVIIDTII